MRAILYASAFLGLVVASFGAVTVATVSPAEAVVCARGVYRAGCVGPRGAVVAPRRYHRRPVYRAPYRRGVVIVR
jgi:hypothetical protein